MIKGSIPDKNNLQLNIKEADLLEENERLVQEIEQMKLQESILSSKLKEAQFNNQSLARRLKSHTDAVLEKNHKIRLMQADIRDFYYAASHYLKTPLRNISSFTQLLKKKLGADSDKETKDYLNFVSKNAVQVNKLLDDLLYYSTFSANKTEVVYVSVESTFKKVLEEFQPRLNALGANVIIKDLPVIRANPELFTELLRQLLDNSLKFIGYEAPEITLDVAYNRNRFLFSFEDNGIGIPEQYSDKIFSLFNRLVQNEKVEGTGTGLTICKKIVELHRGQIWFNSMPGHGSVFYFTIPMDLEMLA